MNRLVLAAAATLAFPAFALAADAPAYSDASSMYVSLHGGILMDPSIDAEIADGVGDPADVPVEFGFDSGKRKCGKGQCCGRSQNQFIHRIFLHVELSS